ncbi:MAG: DMT family transporter [Planctomycetota bacterium]|jgi:drug/metabolite transporter (DMT)-like permease
MDKKFIGIMAGVACSLMWAVELIFIKLSYENADFVQTTGIRTLIVAATAIIYVLLTKNAGFRIKKNQLPWIVYIALVGTVFADLCFLYALTTIPIINAALIAHIQPIFIVLLGIVFLKSDRITAYDYLGIAGMIIAALLVSTKTPENLVKLKLGTMGDLMVFFAMIGWATCSIVARKHFTALHSGTITLYRFCIAGACFAVYLAVTSNFFISNIWQVLAGIVVGIGYILYYESVKRIKAAQTAALELTSPFFAAVLGFLILSEIPTPMQGAGMLFLLVGIWFLAKKEPF